MTHEWFCCNTAYALPVLLMQRLEMRATSFSSWLVPPASLERSASPDLINAVDTSRHRCFTSTRPTSKTVSPLVAAPPMTSNPNPNPWHLTLTLTLTRQSIRSSIVRRFRRRSGTSVCHVRGIGQNLEIVLSSLSPLLCISLFTRWQFSFWFCIHFRANAHKCLSPSLRHCDNAAFSRWMKLNQLQHRYQWFTVVALYFPISNWAYKCINILLNLIITLGERLQWYMWAHHLAPDGFALQIKLITASRAILSVACDSTN